MWVSDGGGRAQTLKDFCMRVLAQAFLELMPAVWQLIAYAAMAFMKYRQYR